MLKEADIDKLMLNIQSGRDAFVYYIAHNVECREGIIDELSYKSIPRFRVIKLIVNNIYNAYFELLKYYEHPENYYTEKKPIQISIQNIYTITLFPMNIHRLIKHLILEYHL